MDIIKPSRDDVRPAKALVWMGSSKKDLLKLPSSVIDVFGYALYLAQTGGRHPDAKVLRGFGDAGVIKVFKSAGTGTYRAVYTVRFPEKVFVLHVFQKKSKSGIATPKADIEIIRERLRMAERIVGGAAQ
jgi:phage-related protein